MVLNKMNKWVDEYTKTLRSKPGKVYKTGAFDKNRERFLKFQKWNKKFVLALTMCEQYYNGLLTKGLKLENSPGNRLEESDLESHEWDNAVIYNSYLLLLQTRQKYSALGKKRVTL